MLFALTYEVVNDFVTRRQPFREEHLRLARQAQARGDLLMAGAVGDPPSGALLVFTSAVTADEFARRDPYVVNRLVTRWAVQPWHVVVGSGSTAP
jgi:uncharacterized protein YciI